MAYEWPVPVASLDGRSSMGYQDARGQLIAAVVPLVDCWSLFDFSSAVGKVSWDAIIDNRKIGRNQG